MGRPVRLSRLRRNLLRASRGFYVGLIAVAWMAPAPVSASAYTVTVESDWWLTVDTDGTLVVVYGNSDRECNEPGADPYLWLYDSDGTLVAWDDDGNHGAGQCVSSKLYVTLDAGQYRVRAGYYPSQRGLGFAGGEYTLVAEIGLTNTATTTTTTSTTSTSTTTTSTTTTSTTTTSTTTTTTTTTVPPSTTSTTTTTATPTTTSTSSTTTVPTVSTTTTVPVTTSTSTTTSSSTTTVPPTTSTSVAPSTSTTSAPPTTTTTSTSTSTTTVPETTTSTTTIPATTSTTSTPAPPATVPAPVATTTTSTSSSTTTSTIPPSTTTTTVAATTSTTSSTQPSPPVSAVPSTTTTLPAPIAKIADALDDAEPELVDAIVATLDGVVTPDEVTALVDAGFESAPPEVVAAVVAVLNDADDDTKHALEAEVNVFSGLLDDYKPAGSNVTVAERRTIVAVTATVASPVSPLPAARRRKV